MSFYIYFLLKHKLDPFLSQWDVLCILLGTVSPGKLDFFIIMISASKQLIKNLVIFIVTQNLDNSAPSHCTLG